MIDANSFRDWARRCHSLAQATTDPEVRHQLQVWAMEFQRDADELDRGEIDRGEPANPA